LRTTGYCTLIREINVRCDVAIQVNIVLRVLPAEESLTVKADVAGQDVTRTETTIDENSIPWKRENRSLQEVVATAPGWTIEKIAERQQDRAGAVQSGIDGGVLR